MSKGLELNSRERVLRTMAHTCEGRIPYSVSPHASLFVHGEKLLKLLYKFPSDFNDPQKHLKIHTEAELREHLDRIDMWGCRWQSQSILIAGAIVGKRPLSDWRDFKTYKLPDVPRVTPKDIEFNKEFREKYPVGGGVEQFFQIMQNLRGTEQLMMDFYDQPEEVHKWIERMLNEYHLPAIEEQLKLAPDIIGTGDDWGSQTQLFIPPDLWHQFFKPVYRRMCDLAHQGGAKVHFHTCGYTLEILEGFIAAGIDSVNPQMPIMDAAKYGDIARGRITVMPDLGRQTVLSKGTPDEVRRHILDMYRHLGTPSGGLIAYAPIEPEMPLDNVAAMLETISNYAH